MKRCMVCMKEYDEKLPACSSCGYSEESMGLDALKIPEAMPPRTILFGRYIAGRVLSMTDYSVIYIGWDALLLKRVAIREYFPLTLAVRSKNSVTVKLSEPKAGIGYAAGKAAFIEEGRRLWKNQDLEETVHIFRVFEENGTAYQVMEYLQGITLQDYLEENGETAGREKAEQIVSSLSGAVEQIHRKGIIHANLAPDNIYLDEEYHILLLDFGMAKWETLKMTHRAVNLFDPHYTAPEVLEGKDVTASSDLYSIGAIYYRLMNGAEPPSAAERDGKKLIFDRKRRIRADIQESIRMLMSPDPEKRRAMDPHVNDRGEEITDMIPPMTGER